MNINEIIQKDDKYYCKKCKREVDKFETVIRSETIDYKKGQKVLWFKHKNRHDSGFCNSLNMPKGYKLSKETKSKMSKSKKDQIPWNKNKKIVVNANTELDYKNNSKEKICPICGNVLFLNIYIRKYNTKSHKKGDIIYYYKHKTLDLDKKCKYSIKSTEESNIYNLLKSIIPNIIWSPNKNTIKSFPYSLNYPGKPDFINPDLNHILEYQGLGGGHNNHPFDPSDPKDIKILNIWKNRSKKFHSKLNNKNKSCMYDSFIRTWTITDPNKRKWCKNNKVKLIEFFNIKDVYQYLNQYYNYIFSGV